MKTSLRVLSSVALAVAGASLASAQSASGFSEGYVYGSFTTSGGISWTDSFGGFSDTYAYGNSASYESRGSYSYLNGFGGATSGPGYGLGYGGSEYYFEFSLTNYSNYTEAAYVTVDTASYSSAASVPGSYGIGESYGWGYDTNGNYDQFNETGALVDNIYGVNEAYAAVYAFGGFQGYAQGGPYYGIYTTSWYASAPLYSQTYEVLLAPGQSDELVFESYDFHEAYTPGSSVPGPAAIAPFALGLVGALRRRKKA